MLLSPVELTGGRFTSMRRKAARHGKRSLTVVDVDVYDNAYRRDRFGHHF